MQASLTSNEDSNMYCKICQKVLTSDEKWDAMRLDEEICRECRWKRAQKAIEKAKQLSNCG
jgi:hypothetical protein